MPEVVVELNLERDHKTYLYFVDRHGNVMRKRKDKQGDSEVLHAKAVQRDPQYLYFINKDGHICRAERNDKREKER